MNPKKKNVEITKLYCLAQLLVESLDVLKPNTPNMVKFKDDLIGLCEELNNVSADTYTVQKSTYFQEISAKIDTILRHQFREKM